MKNISDILSAGEIEDPSSRIVNEIGNTSVTINYLVPPRGTYIDRNWALAMYLSSEGFQSLTLSDEQRAILYDLSCQMADKWNQLSAIPQENKVLTEAAKHWIV